jgi:hypothetical protein
MAWGRHVREHHGNGWRGRLLAGAALYAGTLMYFACGGRTPLDGKADDDGAPAGRPDATLADADDDATWSLEGATSDAAPVDASPPDATPDVSPPPLDAASDVPLPPPPPDGGVSTCFTQSVLTLAMNVGPLAIALDDQYVYWSDYIAVSLLRVPKHGGTVTTVRNLGWQMTWGLAMDSDNAYLAKWAGNDGGPLVRVPKDGGTPTTIANAWYGDGIDVDDASVYWTETSQPFPGHVWSVPKDGGTSVLLTTSYPDDPVFVRADGGYLYYTRWEVGGGVSRIPTQGGSPTTLASVPFANDLAVDANYVYFTSQDFTVGGVWRVPKQGGTATQLVYDSAAQNVALDGAWVYYTDFANVRKVPKAGGAYVDVAVGQQNARAIAVDADCVYWSGDPGVGYVRVGPK